MISKTGDGLKALIRCEYVPHHNWMAFVSWYSISKNLPDAHIMVHCKKNSQTQYPLFSWATKANVEFSYNNKFTDFNLEIPCDWMAVRTWDEKNLFGDAKSDDVVTFSSYKNGCGNFVLSEWINSMAPPFTKVDAFDKELKFANEIKILELWRKVMPIYSAIW